MLFGTFLASMIPWHFVFSEENFASEICCGSKFWINFSQCVWILFKIFTFRWNQICNRKLVSQKTRSDTLYSWKTSNIAFFCFFWKQFSAAFLIFKNQICHLWVLPNDVTTCPTLNQVLHRVSGYESFWSQRATFWKEYFLKSSSLDQTFAHKKSFFEEISSLEASKCAFSCCPITHNSEANLSLNSGIEFILSEEFDFQPIYIPTADFEAILIDRVWFSTKIFSKSQNLIENLY